MTRVTIQPTDNGYRVHGGGRGMFAAKIHCRHFSTALAIKGLMKNDTLSGYDRWNMIDTLLIDEPIAQPVAVPASRLHLVVSR